MERSQIQKQKERCQILSITAFLGIDQDILLENLETNRPDFKMKWEGKNIGIEVTEIRPHQKRNENQEIVVDPSAINRALEKTIRNRLKINNIETFRIDVIPQESIYQSKLNIRDRELLEEIDKYIKGINESHQFIKSLKISQFYTPDREKYIIKNEDIGVYINWEGGIPDLICPKHVINAIRKKELLYPDYNLENNYCFDELWLFIVLSRDEHGYTFKGFELPYSFSSSFNRIYVGQDLPPFANCIFQK